MKPTTNADLHTGVRRFQARKQIFCGLMILFSLRVFARDRLAPSIEWKELPSSHFIVVFPEGYEHQAGEIAQTAGRQYKLLSELWKVSIESKIRLLLAPDSDVAGGSITLFPFPAIRIDMAPPSPDSRLSGGKEPWLDKVLAHELTRLLLLHKSSGFFKHLRRGIGPLPFTFPMMQYPSWVHEGLAVFSESLICPSGRLNTPDYRQMFQHIASQGGFQHFLSLRGSPSRWPGPVTKFIYGAEFFRFLGDRYGHESLQRLVTHLSRVPISLGISLRFKHVFHQRLRKLWRQFGLAAGQSEKSDIALRPLTHDGWIKQYPEIVDNGKLVWVSNNYRSRPGIRILDQRTGKSAWLLRRWGISSLAYDVHHQQVVFSAPEVFRSFRWISDIYSCSTTGGECRRWSRGKSLFHPHPFPDGSGFICVSRDHDRFRLARLNTPLSEPVMLSAKYVGLAHPRVSPDGNQVAAAIKLQHKNWSIALFTPAGKLESIIHLPERRCSVPRWLDNNRLAFVLSGQENSTIAMANLSSRRVQVMAGLHSPGIRYLSVPGNDCLLAVFLNAGGEDLAEIHIQESQWTDLAADWSPAQALPQPESIAPSRNYNKWRDLAPRFVSPDGNYVERELQIGARVSGRDLPGRYDYRAQILYGLRTQRWNTDMRLMLGGFFPRVTMTWRREHQVLENRIRGDFIQTNAFLNLEAQFPLKVRRQYRWDLAVGIHVNQIQDRSILHDPDETVKLNGFSLTLICDSDQRYYDAFTRTDGGRFVLMTSWDVALWGSSPVRSLALDWRRYISLSHPNVLALRMAVAHSWGEAPRVFYMGGASAQNRAGLVEGGLFSLMRGFPAGYASGFGGWQFNMETRLQLLKIERALPVGPSFERLYMALFCDIGNMWTQRLRFSPMLTWGAELGVLLYLGGSVEVALGMAVNRSLPHNPTIYFRIGESF